MSSDNRAFYDRIAHAYDLLSDSSERAAREKGEALLAVQPGQRILELGFGTGNTLIELARKVGASGEVVGIDISEGMREVARGKLEKEGLMDRVMLTLGDARELPFEDDQFDGAFLSFTLELFSEDDMAKVLKEIRRVLKPGAELAVVSMAKVASGEHESLLERGYQWMHQHFPHIVDCRPIDVKKTLEASGFQVEKEERLEMWTMPVVAAVGR
ncbi:MAG: class I SAM-dependent methyltransferase [Planctomycetota bacterium]